MLLTLVFHGAKVERAIDEIGFRGEQIILHFAGPAQHFTRTRKHIVHDPHRIGAIGNDGPVLGRRLLLDYIADYIREPAVRISCFKSYKRQCGTTAETRRLRLATMRWFDQERLP